MTNVYTFMGTERRTLKILNIGFSNSISLITVITSTWKVFVASFFESSNIEDFIIFVEKLEDLIEVKD